MTISDIQQADYFNTQVIPENIKKDQIKEENSSDTSKTYSGLQKELSQILANIQPPHSVRDTAQRQLANGRVDIKI
ncbi:MAG: hypothetical protein NTW25_07890 [Candidatus Kapabacteria bacterium]|jgi:hypothetical protein|nr:hypothetical protein [Candidatus Kapabacteria bacterium]